MDRRDGLRQSGDRLNSKVSDVSEGGGQIPVCVAGRGYYQKWRNICHSDIAMSFATWIWSKLDESKRYQSILPE